MGWRSRLRSAIGSWLPRRRARRGWWTRPHAPQFRLAPSAEQLPDGRTVRVLMTFQQRVGADVEARLQARWRGAGITEDFAIPLRDIRERTYAMKPTIADPTAATDDEIAAEHVAFEIRFRWEDADRHCLWVWPLREERGGRWVLEATAANTDRPVQCW